MTFEIDAKRGVANHYGVRTTNQKFGGQVDDDLIKTAAWTFSYSDLPAGGTNKLQYSIPAYAKILNARLEIITAFTSTSTTTDLEVGLEQADGTDIDLDGLVTAANATQTTIGAVGLITGSGALVGASIGAAAGEVVVTPSVADLLTGEARLVVQYLPVAP
jgi:hypothetical protein